MVLILRKQSLVKKNLFSYISKRFDTSAFNWHKIFPHWNARNCPTTSTVWAPRWPLFGGRSAPSAIQSYPSVPAQLDENTPILNFDGEKRIDEVLSSNAIRLGSRADVLRWIQQGRISVNGKELHNVKYISSADDVLLDSKPLQEICKKTFLMFKPKSSLSFKNTKMDLAGKKDWMVDSLPHVIGVNTNVRGGMDLWYQLPSMPENHEGLLLFTSDVAVAQRLARPYIPTSYRFDLTTVSDKIRCDQGALDLLAAKASDYSRSEVTLTRLDGDENEIAQSGHKEDVVVLSGRSDDLARLIPKLYKHFYSSLPPGSLPAPVRRIQVGPFMLGDLSVTDVRDVSPLVERILPEWRVQERIVSRNKYSFSIPVEAENEKVFQIAGSAA